MTDSLLSRVAANIAQGSPSETGKAQKSILSQAAASYARKPDAEETVPTGFDPRAASLFEAVVEAAFLVANADGVFDEKEREIFETVVAEACANTVQVDDVSLLVADLIEQFEEDGLERRIQMVSSVVQTDEHKLEVLRIAALMAWTSGGVDDSERALIHALARGFGLDEATVSTTLDQAQTLLGH